MASKKLFCLEVTRKYGLVVWEFVFGVSLKEVQEEAQAAYGTSLCNVRKATKEERERVERILGEDRV